jgi:hypothetical protein
MGDLLKNIQYNRCTDAVFYQILCTVWYLLQFSLYQVWPLAGQLGPAARLARFILAPLYHAVDVSGVLVPILVGTPPDRYVAPAPVCRWPG